jgi:aminopeptidase N
MARRNELAALVLLAAAAPAFADPQIRTHSIECRLDPATSRIEATDRISVVRDGGGALAFSLNAGLTIDALSVDGRDAKPTRAGGDEWLARWTIEIPSSGNEMAAVEIRYAGAIADQVRKSETLSFVVGDDTRGVICAEGAYLSDASGWYPNGSGTARYHVKPSIDAPFVAVTQGTHDAASGWWRGKYDADGLSLVAGKWKRAERKVGDVVLGTYLGEESALHADLLLDALASYLPLYGEMLGPYAYDRFDIVENWFTTGYGMPEFTLLGRDVIARIVPEAQRTGSIPAGYLGHELVHCWWGNLVFPDYETGNWCEGLTSYCANYMEKERAGPDPAREDRRRNCVRFTIRATPQRDYPVRRFRSKSEDVDDDIGYGKCSMVFHALRRDLGDAAFWETLRRVAREYRGRRFSWDDWRREFETTSKRNLAAWFEQALDRTGAPTLSVRETSVSADGGRLRVTGTLSQTLAEGEKPWHVTVPVVVEHLEGREETFVDCVAQDSRFSVLVPSLPLRVTVDPEFEVFRKLAADEVPPCLAATLAQAKKVVVYPDGDEPMKAAAEAAAARSGGEAMPASKAPAALAPGVSYLVFGDAARVPLLASLQKSLPRHFPGARATDQTTVLATARSPADPEQFVTTFVGPAAAAGKRARAVFYYQYDGRIVFEGSVPRERAQVPTVNRATRTLLPDFKSAGSPESVRAIVDKLAAPEMKGRLAGSPEDKEARKFVAEQFTLAGLPVDEQAFSFTVKRLERAALGTSAIEVKSPGSLESSGEIQVETRLIFVASPGTGDQRLALAGIAFEPEADLKGRALVVQVSADAPDPLATLRATADLVKSRGAAALLVRLPAEPSKQFQDLMEFPKEGVAAYRAAATAARTGSDRELSLPAFAVAHDVDLSKLDLSSIDIDLESQTVSSANVIARVKAGGRKREGVIVLGAHHDHLGEGFPGGDDNASGVAALVEAGRILAAHADLLARDVVLVAFGAEEWGLRGSKAFLEAWPKDQPIVAMINADTVGRRGVPDVNVVGVSKHPRLAQVVAAAIEQANLDVGRDIDKFAFAHGSDHWTFHEAKIPAVDLWSGDYAVMHTANDTPDGVDEQKAARIGRAMALAAFGVAGGY